MPSAPRTATLGMVLTELGAGARLVVGSEDDLDRAVTGASVLTELQPPEDAGVVLICPRTSTTEELATVVDRLSASTARILLLTSAGELPDETVAALAPAHTVVGAAGALDPASAVLAVARAVDVPDETVTRRLATLQRSLTQVLGEPDPLAALIGRLKSTCNATVALVDKHGSADYSTGPIPLALLFRTISHTTAETQMIDVDGWFGIADRIHDTGQDGDHAGWLVVVARRQPFPDAYTISAVHVAAALVEASQRTTLVARQQERAIRAAVLEEALALRREPDDPELAGRIASLGLSFTDELRALVVRSARASGVRGRPVLREIAEGLTRALEKADIDHLLSVRDEYAVLVVQASPSTIRRVVVASGSAIPALRGGIGRPVGHVGEVVDSYHDAQLALQTLRRAPRRADLMAYEDFDFATRLFSDVGMARMAEWADEFLRPLDGRAPLLEGLTAYFAHNQNMNEAADFLSIHHNSLRYRLSKIEELLEVSLRDPAAVSSLFLALAARDLAQETRPAPAVTRIGASSRPSDVEALSTPSDYTPPGMENLGVVLGPDR